MKDRRSFLGNMVSGPIQLQTHGGEIRWRNVFIREIDAHEAKTIQANTTHESLAKKRATS